MTSAGVSRSRATGFTLIEIMIVVAVIALLAAIAVPGFLRARKRSQAADVLNDLRMIDSAVNQYAIENGKTGGGPVAVDDWMRYVKPGTRLAETGEDVLGNEFGPQTVDETPTVPAATYFELSDVADNAFWEPFDP
jgi:prepilin-type N-terminal cleavage/methylation domain-containing protein